jgi:hypothetical protein
MTSVICVFVFYDPIHVAFVFFYLSTCIVNLVLKIPRSVNTYPVNIQSFILNFFKTCKFEF